MSPLLREAIRLDHRDMYRDDIAAGWLARCEFFSDDTAPTTS